MTFNACPVEGCEAIFGFGIEINAKFVFFSVIMIDLLLESFFLIQTVFVIFGFVNNIRC